MDGWLRLFCIGWTVGQGCVCAMDHACVMGPVGVQHRLVETMRVAVVILMMVLMNVLHHRLHF